MLRKNTKTSLIVGVSIFVCVKQAIRYAMRGVSFVSCTQMQTSLPDGLGVFIMQKVVGICGIKV